MRIVAAIDLSDMSNAVLGKAVNLAKKEGAGLTIVTVAEDFRDALIVDSGMDMGGEELLQATKDYASKAKEAASQQGVDAELVVERNSSPAEAIVQVAEEKKADLIVMGHRSKKGLRFLVGSNVAKVVEHAPCSVLVVK